MPFWRTRHCVDLAGAKVDGAEFVHAVEAAGVPAAVSPVRQKLPGLALILGTQDVLPGHQWTVGPVAFVRAQ